MDDAQIERVAMAIQEAHRLHGRSWREMAKAAIKEMVETPDDPKETDGA